MERCRARNPGHRMPEFPDFASLHPGYEGLRIHPASPELLADQAVDARFPFGKLGRHDARRRTCDLQHQLAPDRLGNTVDVLDRDEEGPGPPDHAILIIDVELADR